MPETSWKISKEVLLENRVHRYTISSEGRKLSYADVVDLWSASKAFRTFFTTMLADCPFEAFFWETPPVTLDTFGRPFEFILTDNPSYGLMQPDSDCFRHHFKKSTLFEGVVQFPNLRADAHLVVPCPIADDDCYPHLSAFVRKAPEAQVHAFWQCLATAVSARLQEQPLWLSTAGMGVFWLHARLDSHPKYYRHKPYRQMQSSSPAY